MFKGKAELTDPEKGGTVATFTEICEDDGRAIAKVVLKHLVELKDTERLEVYGGPNGTEQDLGHAFHAQRVNPPKA